MTICARLTGLLYVETQLSKEGAFGRIGELRFRFVKPMAVTSFETDIFFWDKQSSRRERVTRLSAGDSEACL